MKMTRIKLNINLIAILLLLLLFTLAKQATAQTLEVSAMVQQTVMGLQKGYAIENRLQNGMGLGIFYQSTRHLSFEKGAGNYPFVGINLSAPIRRCGDISVLAQIKSGLVNQKFFIITPEIETRIALTKFIKLGVAAGIRSRQASISGKIIVHTF